MSDNHRPIVAVMVTGKHPERLPLAKVALECWRRQTWPAKKLVIVQDTGQSLLPELGMEPGEQDIVELVITKRSLGELRNAALEFIEGAYHYAEFRPWVIQWDDDDWYHPERMGCQAFLTEIIKEGVGVVPTACTLEGQVRYSFISNSAFWLRYRDKGETGRTKLGIPGSILHELNEHRYEAVGKHEDSRFLKLFQPLVYRWEDKLLYVRLAHSFNTWDERHIMRGATPGVWRLPKPQMHEQLAKLLQEDYGVSTARILEVRREVVTTL